MSIITGAGSVILIVSPNYARLVSQEQGSVPSIDTFISSGLVFFTVIFGRNPCKGNSPGYCRNTGELSNIQAPFTTKVTVLASGVAELSFGRGWSWESVEANAEAARRCSGAFSRGNSKWRAAAR